MCVDSNQALFRKILFSKPVDCFKLRKCLGEKPANIGFQAWILLYISDFISCIDLYPLHCYYKGYVSTKSITSTWVCLPVEMMQLPSRHGMEC